MRSGFHFIIMYISAFWWLVCLSL